MVDPTEALANGLGTDRKALPALLVSFFYFKAFQLHRARFRFRDWVMDSGAFSAENSGKVIDLQEYTETCSRMLRDDDQLTEVFSLDVISDWRAGAKNTEFMWAHGVPAIPTYHMGEPWDVLEAMARDYPKIALGGVVGEDRKKKLEWVGQCFARVWPKRVHGFGMGSKEMILSFPFESVDATNWELGPCAFGQWRSFGGRLSVKGGSQDLRREVAYYLEIERLAQARWRREIRLIKGEGPNIRLAEIGASNSRKSFKEKVT